MPKSSRRWNTWILGRLGCVAILATMGLAGCGGEDSAMAPVEFGPPGTATFVTGSTTIQVSWGGSAFEPSTDFSGYNIYIDIAPFASNNDEAFLAARIANAIPVRMRSFTVSQLGDGSSLQPGVRYYLHVRTLHKNGTLSVATNEIDTAPRPEGNNGSDVTQFLYDHDSLTSTKSGYGWNIATGTGVSYSAVPANEAAVDLFMIEEPNSPDDGSLLVSPSLANFTAGWTVRNTTLFADLGTGDAAWRTANAPSVNSMSTSIKLLQDHTYAIRTHDNYWVKVRVRELVKNAPVMRTNGNQVLLNYAKLDFAFQLIQDYGRF